MSFGKTSGFEVDVATHTVIEIIALLFPVGRRVSDIVHREKDGQTAAAPAPLSLTGSINCIIFLTSVSSIVLSLPL